MHKSWTVLGGWGVEPEVLQPIFGGQSDYVDINLLMASIVNNNTLRPDWRERCVTIISPYLQGNARLAGWSTGAIIALACCDLLKPDALVLISTTRSFCRSSDHPYGMRSALLEAMRRKLPTETTTVLCNFRTRCGLPNDTAASIRWSPDDLAAGLHALEQITLSPMRPLLPPPLIVHGRADAIIPFAAAESAHRTAGGNLLMLDAPHACFVNNEKKIRIAIEHYLKELDHEPV